MVGTVVLISAYFLSAAPQKQLLKFFSTGSSALGISGLRRVSWMLEAAGKVWWGFLDHGLKCRYIIWDSTVTFGICFFQESRMGYWLEARQSANINYTTSWRPHHMGSGADSWIGYSKCCQGRRPRNCAPAL